MGYTHYWTQRRNFKADEWWQVDQDMRELLKYAQETAGVPLANGMGENGTTPEFDAIGMFFNGIEDDSHEGFMINRKREPLDAERKRIGFQRGWDFCKTARKPYDVAVTAALCYLASVLETHSVSSDGHGADWLAGLELAKAALPRYANKLDIPLPIMESDRWVMPWISHRTTRYSFNFCVDGRAYIQRLNDGVSYAFPSHADAITWAKPYVHILQPTGYFDEKRNAKLKRDQNRLFGKMIDKALPFWPERSIKPPAFVRPDTMPAVGKNEYWLKDAA